MYTIFVNIFKLPASAPLLCDGFHIGYLEKKTDSSPAYLSAVTVHTDKVQLKYRICSATDKCGSDQVCCPSGLSDLNVCVEKEFLNDQVGHHMT